MTTDDFVAAVVASYPQALRPDEHYINQLKKHLCKYPHPSVVLEEAFDLIKISCRMFPGMADLNAIFTQANSKVQKSNLSAWESWNLKGYSYSRQVEISTNGEVLTRPLPEGATDYVLSLPQEMRSNDEPISFAQAYAEGCISESLYQAIRAVNEDHPRKGRFQQIGEYLHSSDDAKPALPHAPAVISDYDDTVYAEDQTQEQKEKPFAWEEF